MSEKFLKVFYVLQASHRAEPEAGFFKQAAAILINFILPLKSQSQKEQDYGLDCHGIRRISDEHICDIAWLRQLDLITSQVAKEVITTLWMEWSARDPLAVLLDDGYLEDTDISVESIVAQVFADNPKAVEDLKGGKKAAVGHLMGSAMKLLGKAGNPKEVMAEINRLIAS